jgi:hypothetical protein
MLGHNSFQSIIRANPETGYTKISNALLQDSRISYETRGLIVELLSRPDDWEITVTNIIKSSPAGRDKVYRMLQEAEKFGHLAGRQARGFDGKMQKQRYAVSDDPRLLAAATELWLLESEAQPFPENPDTVIPFPEKPEAVKLKKAVAAQSTSGKTVSGEPLPEKPLPAEPLPANPTHTNKRYIQTTQETKGGDGSIVKVAAAVASTFTTILPLAAIAHPIEQVIDAPAECWQTPKARMAAGMNPMEAKLQRQVWVTSNGRIEVAGDFKAELEREFPLVDLKCGLSTSGPNVHTDRGAIQCAQTIRREFGFMQQREKKTAERAEQWEKPDTSKPKIYRKPNPWD